MFKKVHVIINPAAGQDRPFIGIMNKVFKEANIDWDIFITKQPGDGQRLAQEAVKAGADVVAAFGGDGTVMEAMSGLLGTKVPLAIIPGGTANVTSAELGVPGDIETACTLIAGDTGMIRVIDVGQVAEHYFILRATIGLTAEIINDTARDTKNRLGSLAYILSAFKALNSPQVINYRLTLDGKSVTSEGITCVVANSGNLGLRGVNLAPTVSISDGLLDILVIQNSDIGALLSMAASVLTGNENPHQIQHWQAHEVKVETDTPQQFEVDGEILGTTPMSAKVLPQALRVIVPKLH